MGDDELQWDAVDEWRPPGPGEPVPRKSGRKSNPNINWALAEKLFVEGELQGEAEHIRRTYPSIGDIAKRVGTSKSNLTQRSWRYNWGEKRRSFQSENQIVAAYTSGKKMAAGDFKPRKLARRDPEAILQAYIDLFADAVEKRTIRYDCIADLDKAIRLLAFVRGQADSVKHTHVTVSLDVMQRRHRELRQQVAQQIDDEVAGVIGGGAPLLAAGDAERGDDDDPDAWDALPGESADAAE